MSERRSACREGEVGRGGARATRNAQPHALAPVCEVLLPLLGCPALVLRRIVHAVPTVHSWGGRGATIAAVFRRRCVGRHARAVLEHQLSMLLDTFGEELVQLLSMVLQRGLVVLEQVPHQVWRRKGGKCA